MKLDEQMLEELMRRDGIAPRVVPAAHLERLRAGLRRRRTCPRMAKLGIAASWLAGLALFLVAQHLARLPLAMGVSIDLGYGNDSIIWQIDRLQVLAWILFFFGLALLLTLGLQAYLRRRHLRRVETSLPHPEVIIKLAGGRH